MPWFIPVGIAVASGAANIISGISESNAQDERIREAQRLMRESLISDQELQDLLDTNKMVFNSKLTSTLNISAIRTKGISNAPVVAGAIAGGIQGQALATDLRIREGVLSQNKKVEQNIARLELGGTSSDPVGDFVSGAASGAALGLEFQKYLGQPTTTSPSPSGEPTFSSTQAKPDRLDPFDDDPDNPYIDYLGKDQIKFGVNTSSFFNF